MIAINPAIILVVELGIPSFITLQIIKGNYHTLVVDDETVDEENQPVNKSSNSPSIPQPSVPSRQQSIAKHTQLKVGTPSLSASAHNEAELKRNLKVGKYAIDSILCSEELVKEFAKFLAKEYSLENLLFVQKVAKFKQVYHKDGPEKASHLYLELMNEFITPNAPNNVNIFDIDQHTLWNVKIID